MARFWDARTLVRDSSTTWSGEPALCELHVPLAQWVVLGILGKGPFPGLDGRLTELVSHDRQSKGKKA